MAHPSPMEPEVGPYGQRLLTHLIDHRARAGHERPFASIPISSDVRHGFRDISYAVFANAINRAAHWLLEHFGRSDSLENVVYIASLDLRYQIFAMAAVKTGHVMFFPSPRNTLGALESLVTAAPATKILSSSPAPPIVAQITAKCSMQHFAVPSLNELLDDTPVPDIPFNGTFEEYRFKPWILLHTSGSTGTPKIVPFKHGAGTSTDAYMLLEQNEVVARYGNMRVFVPFPPFHVAGFSYTLPVACWVDSTAVFPPPGVPLNADLIHAIHENASVDHSMLAPSLVADLAKNPTFYAGLSRLSGLTFAGGPLGPDTAHLVAQKTKLTSSMGATEYGGIPMLPKDPEDWQYFRFNEAIGGIDFRHVDNGLHEMVFVREPKINLIQAIFVTFPDIDEYHTKDLYTKHPTKPGLWKYASRLDDILVLSNGEKLNPVEMEGTISACPEVKGCLVIGQGRFQTALIVEPEHPDKLKDDLLEAVFPFVEKANAKAPKYGQVAEDLIFFTAPGQTLARAPKGTVQRSKNYTIFEDEIATLYSKKARTKTKVASMLLDLSTPARAEGSLRALVSRELDIKDFSSTDDLFNLGMDSLLVMNMVRAINAARGDAPPIDQTHIYENPSVAELIAALRSGVKIREYSDFDSDDEDQKATWTSMEETYKGLLSELPEKPSRLRPRHNFLISTDPPPIYQPDGGWHAWLQVLGAFLINLNNWGLVNSFGVYQTYYETTLLSNYSPSSIAWIGTLQGSLLLIVGVVSGPLFDKGYFRALLITAGVGVVFALMMLSLATKYYQIILAQGVLVGLCLGLLYIPSVALIPLYFKKHRGLALGLATAGGSCGGVIYPVVFRRLLTELSFGWANRVMGFIALATLATSVLLIKPIGPRATRQLFDRAALTDLPYVSFMVAGFLLFAGVLVPFFLVSSYAQGTLSTSTDLSFYLLAVLNAAQFAGRVIPSWLSDYVGPEMLLLAAEIVAGIMGFSWIAVHSTAGYVVWLVFFGFMSGVVVTLPAVVMPYICPNLAVIGTRLGMLYSLAGIGFLISTPVATQAAKSTGGYLGAQIWIGACCLGAALFYAVTAAEAWKRRRLYESRKFAGV